MPLDLNRAAVNAGKSSGYSGMIDRINQTFSPERAASRAEARLRKAQADKQLKAIQGTGYTADDISAMQQEQSQLIQESMRQAQIANQNAARQQTYQAFDRFEADGDLRHINRGLQDLHTNPAAARLFEDVSRFDQLTAADEELLQQYGLTAQDLEENPELHKLLVRATMKDGTTGIVPMNLLYAGTGYDQYLLDRQLTEMERRANILYRSQARNAAGSSANERIATRMTDAQRPADIDESEWVAGNPEYDAAYIANIQDIMQNNRAGTQQEREAMRRTDLARPPEVPIEQWRRGNPEYDEAYAQIEQDIIARERQTSTQKELQAANEAKGAIDALAMADNKTFFDYDFNTDQKARLKFEPYIQEIARLSGAELTQTDRTKAMQLRELLALGTPVSEELSEAETGLWDRFLRGIRSYVSNNPAGLELTSAYGAYRNMLRHSLFGSALTPAEIKSFNEQFGTLGQQLGPVLAQFKTNLRQVKSQLESLINLNDSYVSHFYLGADNAKLGEIIEALDERIALFDRGPDGAASTEPVYVQPQRPSTSAPQAPVVPPENAEQVLDDLFSEIFGS